MAKLVELAPEIRKQVKLIKKTYGHAKEFRRKARISQGAFEAAADKGWVTEPVAQRIEAALQPTEATKEAVINSVLTTLNVQREELTKIGTDARAITAYLLKEETDMSLSAIARELNYDNHSSVIVAYKKVENIMDIDPEYRKKVDKCRRNIVRTPKND